MYDMARNCGKIRELQGKVRELELFQKIGTEKIAKHGIVIVQF